MVNDLSKNRRTGRSFFAGVLALPRTVRTLQRARCAEDFEIIVFIVVRSSFGCGGFCLWDVRRDCVIGATEWLSSSFAVRGRNTLSGMGDRSERVERPLRALRRPPRGETGIFGPLDSGATSCLVRAQ